MTEPEFFPFAGGSVSVVSLRCPGKEAETPNEDGAALLSYSARAGLLCVADGVGGMRCGDVASELALRCLQQEMGQLPPGRDDLRPAVLDGIEQANHEVMRLGGAATTLAVVEVGPDWIRPYHVGDSMILLVGQRGRIKLQTVAHSPVGYAVEAGMLDEADAIHHADRHLVSNVVGESQMRIEIGPRLKMAPRDTLVIASDGLSDNLHVEEIVERVRIGTLEKCAVDLTEFAAQRMHVDDKTVPHKPDDLTVLLFRRAASRPQSQRRVHA
jgi:serine/threonine protein phosphatase PrpC